jgi:hypothetical protein
MCPTDLRLPGGTRCMAAGGECDPEDYCTGLSDVCPRNTSADGRPCGSTTSGRTCRMGICL